MDKLKITEHQLFSLTACFACGSAILIIASGINGIAHQDSWLSALITPILGMVGIWIITLIGSKYPGMSLLEILQQIFGKWVGRIATVVFVFFCFDTAPQLPWYLGSFVTSQSMPETPGYAVKTLFISVIVIAALYGLEAISRASEIFIYFVSVMFIAAIILVSTNVQPENLLPVFEKGLKPVLKGSFFQSCFYVFPMIIILSIYPHRVNDVKKARKSIMKGFLWAGFMIFLSILMSVLVLGSSNAAGSQYPIYRLAKEIQIGIIISRFEFVVAIVWIATIFIRSTLFFYAGTITLSQVLGLKNHKNIILPLGLILVVMSDVIFPNLAYQANWDMVVWPPFSITIGFLFPLAVIAVHMIKKHLRKSKLKGT